MLCVLLFSSPLVVLGEGSGGFFGFFCSAEVVRQLFRKHKRNIFLKNAN